MVRDDAGADGSLDENGDQGSPRDATGDAGADRGGDEGANDAAATALLGCSGSLRMKRTLPARAELAGTLFSTAEGYAAFYEDAEGSFLVARLDAGLRRLAAPNVLLPAVRGARPYGGATRDGNGFLVAGSWWNDSREAPYYASQVGTLDETGAPVWTARNDRQAFGSFPYGQSRPLATSPTAVFVANASDGFIVPRDVTVIPRGPTFDIGSICRTGIGAVAFRTDRFEFVCGDQRIGVRLDGRTSAEPLTAPPSPADAECTWARHERRERGVARILNVTSKGDDGCAFRSRATLAASASVWATTLDDGSRAFSPMTKLSQFSNVRGATLASVADSEGVVSFAANADGRYVIERASLAGESRGASFVYTPPGEADRVRLTPIRRGYLAVSYATPTLVQVDELTCD